MLNRFSAINVIRPDEASILVSNKRANLVAFVVGLVSILFCIVIYRKATFRFRVSPVEQSYGRKERNENDIAISICLNRIILQKDGEVAPELVDELGKLAGQFKLFLIAEVPSEQESENILKAVQQTGLFSKGLAKHRILFCGSGEGRVSMLRQLQPSLHVDFDEATSEKLVGKIPSVVFLGSNGQAESEEADGKASAKVTVIGSFQELLQLLPIAPTPNL